MNKLFFIIKRVYYTFMLFFYKKPECGYFFYSLLLKDTDNEIINNLRKIPFRDMIVKIDKANILKGEL